jgi:hypothetical protein
MSAVTISATVELTNVPPRVRLDVTDTGTPAIGSVTVTRLNPTGELVPVRTFDGNPLQLTTSGSNRVGLLYDYEMPYGQAVSYSTMETPANTSGAVTVDEQRIWLVHPGVPGLSQPIELRPDSLKEETYAVKQGVFWPMGRATPVIVNDGTRKSAESQIVAITESLPALGAMKALLSDGGTLLLNIPPLFGLGVDTCYIRVADLTIRRLSDIGSQQSRDVVMPYTVVAMPVGGSQAQRTYVDLLNFATYAALQNAYPTYTAVFAGP